MPNNAMPYQAPQASPKASSRSDAAPDQKVKREEIPHPNQMDKGSGTKEAFENEGEGSRSAARNYDAATERYVKSGRVEDAAREAEEALEGPEGDTLRNAEIATAATRPDLGEAKRR